MDEAIRRRLAGCANCNTSAEECQRRMDRAVSVLAASVASDPVLSRKAADRNACCQSCKHVVMR